MIIKVSIAIGIILMVVVGYFYFNSDDHRVILTNTGFEPRQLTVKAGEVVTFAVDHNSQFWPASNVHPLHTVYPEFDPKKPIPPNESWTFIFDSPGVYRYHGHIRPQYKGEIKVLSQSSEKIETDCSANKTPACWEELMIETLKTSLSLIHI